MPVRLNIPACRVCVFLCIRVRSTRSSGPLRKYADAADGARVMLRYPMDIDATEAAHPRDPPPKKKATKRRGQREGDADADGGAEEKTAVDDVAGRAVTAAASAGGKSTAAAAAAVAAAAGEVADDGSNDDGKGRARPTAAGRARQPVTVTVSDVERLSEGEFLNDTIIEFYLRCV
jgi:hypothetical protein